MENNNLVVWALFDSGNGCYTQALAAKYNVYPIGINIEGETKCLNLDLSCFDTYFGKNTLFDELDKLPKPDVIIASPPCESWSRASNYDRGNRTFIKNSHFIIRGVDDFNHNDINKSPNFKNIFKKTIQRRINGELCAFNTWDIIEKYKPKTWIIENPQTSMIWDYYETTLGIFGGVKNIAHYSAYDNNFSKKPTCFYSNRIFNLKKQNHPAEKELEDVQGYNERSNIPIKLIKHIFEQIENGALTKEQQKLF